MAKTKPIGVRFRPEVLEKLEKEHGVTSPQAALVFLERFYCQHWELTKSVTAPLRDKGQIKPIGDTKVKKQETPSKERKRPQNDESAGYGDATINDIRKKKLGF